MAALIPDPSIIRCRNHTMVSSKLRLEALMNLASQALVKLVSRLCQQLTAQCTELTVSGPTKPHRSRTIQRRAQWPAILAIEKSFKTLVKEETQNTAQRGKGYRIYEDMGRALVCQLSRWPLEVAGAARQWQSSAKQCR